MRVPCFILVGTALLGGCVCAPAGVPHEAAYEIINGPLDMVGGTAEVVDEIMTIHYVGEDGFTYTVTYRILIE